MYFKLCKAIKGRDRFQKLFEASVRKRLLLCNLVPKVRENRDGKTVMAKASCHMIKFSYIR